MKKLFVLLLLVVNLTVISSCEKYNIDQTQSDTEENKQGVISNDVYYIEYKAYSSYMYTFLDALSYNDVYGSGSYRKGAFRGFSIICGPVEKGFDAKISISAYRGNMMHCKTSIAVSKNDSPFIIKATGTLSASYTIDF